MTAETPEDVDAIHHLEINCTTGEITRTPLTEAELADHHARIAEHENARAVAIEQRSAHLAAVAASEDPAVRALAALLGFGAA